MENGIIKIAVVTEQGRGCCPVSKLGIFYHGPIIPDGIEKFRKMIIMSVFVLLKYMVD
jgi:hypothetical protein